MMLTSRNVRTISVPAVVRHTTPPLRSNNKTLRRLSNYEMQRPKVGCLTPGCSAGPEAELLDNS